MSPKEAGLTYEISLFRPDDAEGIARLFRAVYGEDYPIKVFYDPPALTRANQEGDYYSIVARSKSGEVIGVVHLFRSAPCRSVYEWGVGLVLKEWRRMGVSTALAKYMGEEVVPRFGMHTVFGEAVTNHLTMQKMMPEYGYVATALEIGLMPGEAFAGEGVTAGRVTTLLGFRCYRDEPQTVYLPAVYEEALRFMYSDVTRERRFREADQPIPSESVCDAKMTVFDFAKVARIGFYQAGSDFAEQLGNLEAQAAERGVVVLQVWVKLTSPWIGHVVDILREKGYFLGGPLPRWFDDDGLLMQKLLCPPYFDSIKLFSDRARRILEFTKADWERASRV
ncbi:MAG: GNAT family N-acetyltransferase [Deltaproteobacteria bacterium]|nr:GNAT family N-acetyltransferase [Deltaproteobacteria bacterium]